jgi:NAD dependent epimerase/dehydratase
MEWERKKVLITGAGGFIGSHLVEEMSKLGANVKVLVRYNSRNDSGMIDLLPSENLKSIDIIKGDMRDSETVRQAIKNVDIVFHLASLIAIPYSYLHPSEVVETNIMGTLNVLNSAREFGIERLVHTSTSEVYGTAQYVPIDENHPLHGQSPYSASKISADMLAESFYRSFNVPISVIRPFNTYGPRQSARAVIPTIITQCLTRKEILLGSLEPTRDLTFVNDTVKGFIKVAESDKSVGQIINIGSGFEISIGELANKIISLIDKSVTIRQVSERLRPEKSEVQRLFADNSKAKRLLNWEPTMVLEDGLNQTIEWIKQHIQFYRPESYVV